MEVFAPAPLRRLGTMCRSGTGGVVPCPRSMPRACPPLVRLSAAVGVYWTAPAVLPSNDFTTPKATSALVASMASMRSATSRSRSWAANW